MFQVVLNHFKRFIFSFFSEKKMEKTSKRSREDSFEKVLCVSIYPGDTFYYEIPHDETFDAEKWDSKDSESWKSIKNIKEFYQIQKDFKCLVLVHFGEQ